MIDKLEAVLAQDEKKHIAFLMELIGIDTSNELHGIRGKEGNAQSLIAQTLEALGAKVNVFEPDYSKLSQYKEVTYGHEYTSRPNVVGTFSGVGNGKSLILNGHIDTMPFDLSDAWESHPLQPQIRNGNLYGRGSCDMKAGLAGEIMAMDAIRRAGITLYGDVHLQSVVDEEGGGSGTLACCAAGYRADGAIVAEPTELKLRPAHMGWLFFRITLPGFATHSSRKWEGVNAIEKMNKFIHFLLDLERKWVQIKRHPYLPPPFFNIGTIHGGTACTTVPNSCTIEMTVRFLPGECDENGWTGAKTERDFKAAIDRFCQGDEWLSEHPPIVELYQFGGACDIGKDHPLIEKAARTIRKISKREVEVSGMESGCDARLLTNYARTPTMVFGPGSLAQAHAVNEYVSVSQYLAYIRELSHFIVSWCNDT